MKLLFASVASAAVALALASGPAAAVVIVADYSQLGTVYGNNIGDLSNTQLVGYTDVTAGFKADFAAAAHDWENALAVSFMLTVTVTLADLSSEHAVGDSLITSTGPGPYYLPATSNIRVDDSTAAPTYVGTNPYDNSAFNVVTQTANLNGNIVNIARFGTAIAGGPADNQYDLLTLFLHEIGHSLGFANDTPSGYNSALNGSCDNQAVEGALTVPVSVTGNTAFNIPVLCSDSSHIDGNIDNGLYNDATIADPGFGVNQRALLTGLDIFGLCAADGATAAQCNQNASFADPNAAGPAGVPEPSTVFLFGAGGLLIALFARRRKINWGVRFNSAV